MEQAVEEAHADEEAIQQLAALTDPNLHQVLSWQQMVAPVQLEHNVEAHSTERLSSDPPEQDQQLNSDSEANIGLNMDQILQDSEAQEGLSVMRPGSLRVHLKVGFEVGLSGRTNHPFSRVVDLTFGQNRSETIYRLRILAVFNLVLHIITGIPYLLQFLHGVHATYMVMFITTVGAPIIVAMISLFISYWFVSDPRSDERCNWITGLLVANIFTFSGRLAFNWLPTQGSGN